LQEAGNPPTHDTSHDGQNEEHEAKQHDDLTTLGHEDDEDDEGSSTLAPRASALLSSIKGTGVDQGPETLPDTVPLGRGGHQSSHEHDDTMETEKGPTTDTSGAPEEVAE
jgi:hypothetical protein